MRVNRIMNIEKYAVFALGVLLSASVYAGNVTLYHEFTGNESNMAPSPASDPGECYTDIPATLPYQDMGGFTVSASGQYRVADIHIGWLTGPKPRSVNTALLIYDGAFNPASPAQNRVAAFDYGEWNRVNGQGWVQLISGSTYRAVLQKTCDSEPGIGGFILRGQGDISGVGFATPARDFGDFALVSNAQLADFGNDGTHKYDQPYSYTAKRGGYHWFYDISAGIGGGNIQFRVYSAPFNPANPAANLLAASEWILMRVYLDAGQQVYVVPVDIFDSQSAYQTIIHTPGDLPGMNSGFTGTYYDPTRDGQGILMDLDDDSGILFAALFTFTSEPVVQLASAGSRKQAVGSGDQRWLTAFGYFSGDSTEVELSFENASGGRFNSETPPVSIDSSYGTGRLVAHDCKRIDVEYSLPEAQGVFTFTRLLPGFTNECSNGLPVAAPEP